MRARALTAGDLPDLRSRTAPDAAGAGLYSAAALTRSAGSVVEANGRTLAMAMATEAHNPLHGGLDGVVHSLFVADGAPPRAAALLAADLEERARSHDWLFLRARLPIARLGPLESAGWAIDSLRVEKQVEAAAAAGLRASPVLIRRAGPADASFVAGLMAEALRAGLHPAERELTSDARLADHARQFVGARLGGSLMALIAEDRGTRVGHALCDVFSDEVSGARKPVLLDTFVLEEARRRGIAAALTDAIEVAAHLNGFRVLRGTVAGHDPTAMRRIAAGLEPYGWRETGATLLATRFRPAASALPGEPAVELPQRRPVGVPPQ